MSNSRFAPITSALLVRKGDALPSAVVARANLAWQREPLAPVPSVTLTKPTLALGTRPAAASVPAANRPPVVLAPNETDSGGESDMPIETAAIPPLVADRPRAADSQRPVPQPDVTKPHRLMVVLSPEEYEQLGIVAVKKGVTRHQLVRHGFELHMKNLVREYASCGCIVGGTSRCSDSCAG